MATQVGNVVFQISADLKNIQGQLRTMENSFQSSFSKIQNIAKTAGGQLASALGIGLSIGGVVGFGKEVLGLADNLQNLSDQTGLSVQLLSGFKSPLEEAGTSMDAFAKGVFNLQKNLGNVDADSDKVAQSIKRLGLNLNDLRSSSPDDFIKKVTDALGQIENPVERNTILFNLLGKSAKELGPALGQLAGRFDELRAKGLTAEDVRTLDDVGDALTRLKNQALILGAEGVAGILRFFGAIRDVPKIGADLDKATAKAAQAFGLSKERVEGMTSKEVIAQAEKSSGQSGLFGQVDKQLAREARDELLNLREEFDKLNKVNVTKPQAAFKGISDGAKKAKSDVQNMVDSFLDGMTKQLAAIDVKRTEGLFGASAGLGAQLDAQLAALKDNLRDKQLPIPKGLDEFFGVLRQKIIGADEALRNLNDSLEETAKRQQALADEANEGVGIIATSTTAQQAAQLKTAQDQVNDLRQQLQIDSIDTSTPAGVESKRVAQIQADFAKTAQKIEELALQAQLSNEESAELTALAWKKALGEIQNKTDEVTEFQRRAMERAFDAGADLLKDVLGGQIKTWQDFGSRVKKVIDEIASDWLTLQLKTLVLGPNFGKSAGGQVGGLAGNIADLFKGGAPSLPTGYGTRPEGMEGPSLPNGGFFSNPVGSIAGGFGSLLKVFGFHEGGVAGTSASFSRAVPSAYFYSAPRYHQGIDFAGGEMPAILKRGEEVGWPDKLAEKYGRGGTVQNFHFHNPSFADRRSAAQVQARIASTAKITRNL